MNSSDFLLERMVPVAESPYLPIVIALISIPLTYFTLFHEPGLLSGFPAVGVDDTGLFKLARARKRWFDNGKEVLAQGVNRVGLRIPHTI